MPRILAADPRWKAASSDVPEKLREALSAIDYMPNAVANWMEAHGDDRALASANEKKIREAQRLLGEVLASLPASVEYMVVGLRGPGEPGSGGTKTFKYNSREVMIQQLEHHGIKQTGESRRGGPQRPEIQGQPTFDKLMGPMYGGPGVVRYETSQVNDSNSR